MWPCSSTTKPVPVAVVDCSCGAPKGPVAVSWPDETPLAVMSTTPGDAPAYNDPASSAEPDEAADEAALVVRTTVVVRPPEPSSAPVAASAPALTPPPSSALMHRSTARGAPA